MHKNWSIGGFLIVSVAVAATVAAQPPKFPTITHPYRDVSNVADIQGLHESYEGFHDVTPESLGKWYPSSCPITGAMCNTSCGSNCFMPDIEYKMNCTVGTAGVFDDFVFAAQSCCNKSHHTMHGLWPNYNRGIGGFGWPQYCTQEKFDLNKLGGPGSPLVLDMMNWWKSCPWKGKFPPGTPQLVKDASFWKHEWERHGVCSGYSQYGYFATALAVLKDQVANTLPKCCCRHQDPDKPCSSCAWKCPCGKFPTVTRNYVDGLHKQICGADGSRCNPSNGSAHPSHHNNHPPRSAYCQPGDPCWPTASQIARLEEDLAASETRDLNWAGYAADEGQVSSMPAGSEHFQALYGASNNDTKVQGLYQFPPSELGTTACFNTSDAAAGNSAPHYCKVSARNQPHRNWNPAFIAFVRSEKEAAAALQFAVDHNLCVMIASTGHEYLNRHSCPTGGMMIRTTAMQSHQFLASWELDPTAAPHGAFKLGPGLTWSKVHQIAARRSRVVSGGWCPSVGVVGWSLGGGHGPVAPHVGLGVDNTLEFEILQVDGESRQVVKRTVNAQSNPQLFWAMKGGGGVAWGLVTSITLKAHPAPKGGFTWVQIQSNGTFCSDPDSRHGWDFLQKMMVKYGQWQTTLDSRFSTQTSMWPKFATTPGDPCTATWRFQVQYYYFGPATDAGNQAVLIDLLSIMEPIEAAGQAVEKQFRTFWDAMRDPFVSDPKYFAIQPKPAPRAGATVTDAQSSVLVARDKLESGMWAVVMVKILKRCRDGTNCDFQYLYNSLTGQRNSSRPDNTALSPGMRHALLHWNARNLSLADELETVYTLSNYSYFSESSYFMPGWTERYWGATYDALAAVKTEFDPLGIFRCHHCIGDNPSNDGDEQERAESNKKATPAADDKKPTCPLCGFPANLNGGVWRSWGAETTASGKFEFDQVFNETAMTNYATSDSIYPNKVCSTALFDPDNTNHVQMLNCTGNTPNQFCLTKQVKSFSTVEISYYACNHSGWPVPSTFEHAMDGNTDFNGKMTYSGNFFMVRCKNHSSSTPSPCHFKQMDEAQMRAWHYRTQPTIHAANAIPKTFLSGAASKPLGALLGVWRALQINQLYNPGMVNLSVTSNNGATLSYPAYPERGVTRYYVTADERFIYLTNLTSWLQQICLFEHQTDDLQLLTSAVLTCGQPGGPAPSSLIDGLLWPNVQFVMARCVPGSRFCRYSCNEFNDNCGAGGTMESP